MMDDLKLCAENVSEKGYALMWNFRLQAIAEGSSEQNKFSEFAKTWNELGAYIASLEAENAKLKKDIEQLNEYTNEMHTDVCKWEAENAELRAELQNARELVGMTPETRWIPVSERLPEDDVNVLTHDAVGDIIFTGYHSKIRRHWLVGGFYYYGVAYKRITHWMPLPEAPEVENGK